jgi:predicted nucleic acid-binding protein
MAQAPRFWVCWLGLTGGLTPDRSCAVIFVYNGRTFAMSKMSKIKLYLDNCCFNRPFDDQSQLIVRLETEAKLFIQEGIKNGTFELVWSYILEQENRDNPFERRREAINPWKLRAQADIDESEEVIQIAESCNKLGLKSKDSLHVACALVAKANFLITTDHRLLKFTHKQVQIVNPIQFVQLYAEMKNYD